jgi:hypothetical protein
MELRHKITEAHTELVAGHIDMPEVRREMFKNEVEVLVSTAMMELVETTNSSAVREDILAEAMCNGMIRSHRYLQGEFWKVFIKAMDMYADRAGTDPRNEWAVGAVKRMLGGLDKTETGMYF